MQEHGEKWTEREEKETCLPRLTVTKKGGWLFTISKVRAKFGGEKVQNGKSWTRRWKKQVDSQANECQGERRVCETWWRKLTARLEDKAKETGRVRDIEKRNKHSCPRTGISEIMDMERKKQGELRHFAEVFSFRITFKTGVEIWHIETLNHFIKLLTYAADSTWSSRE